jgi:hypothetical protein
MTRMTLIQKSKSITTLADVRPLLPKLYSESSAEAMASTLDRVLRLTGSSSLSQVPAEVVAWEAMAATIVWTGQFRAATPSKAKRDFDKFVGRVSAIIRRAHAYAAPMAPRPVGVEADWNSIATYVAANPGLATPDGSQLINSMSPVTLANLRARVGQVAPRDVSTEIARHALVSAPAGKRDSLRRSVRWFNGLIRTRAMHEPIVTLLPSAAIGALPAVRDAALDWSAFGDGFVETRDAATDAAMRPEPRSRGKDRFGGRLGEPALRGSAGGRRGRRRPVRNRTIARKAHHAALSWLARHAFPDASDLAKVTDVRDLLTETNVDRALRVYVERANASEVLKDADKTASLTTWLSSLATLARRGLGDDDLAWEIEEKKFEEDVETFANREMSASRAAFVRLIDYDPSVARTIILAPQTLHAEAQRHLAQLILQPIAGQMAEETSEKLGGPVQIDVVRPMQAFDAGGKARALATMVAALAQAKEAGIEGATLQDALAFIDWADDGN